MSDYVETCSCGAKATVSKGLPKADRNDLLNGFRAGHLSCRAKTTPVYPPVYPPRPWGEAPRWPQPWTVTYAADSAND